MGGSFRRFFPSPRCTFRSEARGLFGFELPHRALPMLFVPAFRLPLGLPKRVGALLDALVFFLVHDGPHFPRAPD